MPIITPAFPSMNSTHNVSLSTQQVILTEFEKANKITELLLKPPPNLKINWKRLFKRFNFFKAYTHFVQIWILSKTEDTFKRWSGWVESKLRKLIHWFEKLNSMQVHRCIEVRPWPRGYKLQDGVQAGYEYNTAYYFGIRIRKNDDNHNIPKKIDMSETIKRYYKKL